MLGLSAIAAGVCGAIWSIGYLFILASNRYQVEVEERLRNFSGAKSTRPPDGRRESAASQPLAHRAVRSLFGTIAQKRAGDMRFLHAGLYSNTVIATFF